MMAAVIARMMFFTNRWRASCMQRWLHHLPAISASWVSMVRPARLLLIHGLKRTKDCSAVSLERAEVVLFVGIVGVAGLNDARYGRSVPAAADQIETGFEVKHWHFGRNFGAFSVDAPRPLRTLARLCRYWSEPGMEYPAPTFYGILALVESEPTSRSIALAEGEALLRSNSVGHNT